MSNQEEKQGVAENEEALPNTEEQDANNVEPQKTDKQETSEIEGLKAKNNEINDKYLRLYSEFDNFRKRSNKEKIVIIKNASEDIIKELLPILDDFDRAVDSNDKTEDLLALREGFKLIQHKFKTLLEKKGLKEMESKGLPFDTDLHEAVTEIPAPEENQKGSVVDDLEKGYYLNDKVIRYAKVVVGK